MNPDRKNSSLVDKTIHEDNFVIVSKIIITSILAVVELIHQHFGCPFPSRFLTGPFGHRNNLIKFTYDKHNADQLNLRLTLE